MTLPLSLDPTVAAAFMTVLAPLAAFATILVVTREDLPDAWVCPKCGAEKQFFEKLG